MLLPEFGVRIACFCGRIFQGHFEVGSTQVGCPIQEAYQACLKVDGTM